MARGDRNLVLVWAVLAALTLLSYESTGGLGLPAGPAAAVALVIGIAMLKVRLVILHFMEVRQAPLALRVPLELWVAAVGLGMLGLWLAATT